MRLFRPALLAFALALVPTVASAQAPRDADDAPVLLALAHLNGSVEARVEGVLRDIQSTWDATPYRYGGTTRRGIDCSALMVTWFRSLFDLELPRTAAAQNRVGETVSRHDLRPGDLVFFNTTGRGVSHVGVYVGGGEFAHSASSVGVSIASLSDEYWAPRYRGAKRVLDAGATPGRGNAAPSFDFDLESLDLGALDLEGMDDEGAGVPVSEAAPAPAPTSRAAHR